MTIPTTKPTTSPSEGKVAFGAAVVVSQEATGQRRRFRIVASEEADVSSGLLSALSPMARSLIGAQEGDTVKVEVPAGTYEYKVLEVKYP